MRGFTLIELLVVVLIIGILASIALPQYELAVYKTRFNKIRPLVDSLARAQELYYLANGQYAADINDLDVGFPSNCVYTNAADSDSVLDCPDVVVMVGYTAGRGVLGLVKNCPVYKPGCVVYAVPYTVPSAVGNFIMGTVPACMVYMGGGMPERALEYGKKVCLSLGGTEKTVIVGMAYVL